ncbi:uncharacterized protein I206_104275 [Kwoniella pini CBS 10737]|uniref:SURP motif domain-containing protein n=1 Tax=Kwoniella pini CBS 10737 TaxID=1296096 RepID=A0A1B9I279_9TREE|nr:uncharacterized protein I206_04149 [Kwoniella pini CBS 10737]OCF49627.1 hypothetical protein I206_04149 [Kwoniella pini CBS 10737]
MSFARPSKRSHHRSQRDSTSNSWRSGPSTSSSSSTTIEIPPTAYIQAYEAQLVYDHDETARDVIQRDSGRGVGLIRYAGEIEVENDVDDGVEREIWIDRHDILHLLPSITIPSNRNEVQSPNSPNSSSSSWDSLPSDLEETFYLSNSEEIEAYQQEKKKKWIEALRQERLREREKEDEEEQIVISTGYNKDEVPPEAILSLMKHTAKAISSSPNSSILEMRILTNHSTDERFSFLKGRYKCIWEKVKNELKKEKEGERRKEEKSKGLGLGGLGGYDSDDDSGTDNSSESNKGNNEKEFSITLPEFPSNNDDQSSSPPPPLPPQGETSPPPPLPHTDNLEQPQKQVIQNEHPEVDEEEKKRLRRLRMEEWKRKRAAEKKLS